MRAPSEAHKNQLVKIQLTQRLTTSVKLNSAFEEVTNQMTPECRMYQAAAQVNVLSTEISNVIEADIFLYDGRQHSLEFLWLDSLTLSGSEAVA